MTLDIRPAHIGDLRALVALLQQLSLGEEQREDTSTLVAYEAAFAAIDADPRQTLLVATDDGVPVATAALVVVPNLSHGGRPYAIVEDVVVDASVRGRGYGEALIRHVIGLAREAGCYKLSLTSNRARTDAHRFYERLGLAQSHFGFRMDL